MLRLLFISLFSFLFVGLLHSQDLPEYNMTNGAVLTDCQGILYDSGGEGNTYGQNENLTTTIQTGGPITLTFFNQFCVQANFDFLSIYDGTDASGTLLGQFTGVNLPPNITALSGAITLVFTSDLNVAYCGFSVEWESVIPPPTPPTMSVLVDPICNSTTIQVNYDQSYPCALFQAANFSVSNQNETFDVIQIAGCSGSQTAFTVLTLDHPIDYSCLMEIELHVDITDACGITYPFDIATSYDYTNCPIKAQAIAGDNQICSGECTNVDVLVESCTDYTYSWNQGLPASAGPHQVCPTQNTTYSCVITDPNTGSSVTRSITITVSSTGITTPEQTLCQSADDIQMTASGAGDWYGDGLEAGTSIFDPDSVAGGGITYVYFETATCLDSVQFTITAIQAEDYTAACQNTGQFALHATPSGGTWSGVFTSANGLFNPVLLGDYVSTYTLNGCTDQTMIHVGNISGEFILDTICQSAWYDTIFFAPPGGTWTGPGIVDDSLGVYSPEQTPGGWVTFNYAINGCNQDFEVFVKPIDIGGSYHTTCPDEAPLVWYEGPTPTPPGGVWTGDGLVNLTTGLFDPGLIANDAYANIYYAAPNGCSDTITVYNLRTTITEDFMDFCFNDDPMMLDEESIGFFGPSGGQWTGQGVQFLGGSSYRFNPATAGPGTHIIYYEKNTCIDSLEMRVYNNVLAVQNLEFCSNEAEVLIDPTVTPGGTWSGAGITNPATGMFNPALGTPGQEYIYWSTPAGCSDSVLVTIELFQQAEISNLNSDYCMLNQIYTFQVDPSGGVFSGPLLTNSFNPSQLGEGDYEVIYTHIGQFCPNTSDTVEFTIHPGLINSLTANDLTLCQDQSVTITAETSGGYPGNNGYSYQWSTGGLAFNTTTTTLSESQYISVTINDGCGPSIMDSIFIEVLQPIETVVTTSDTLCLGEEGFASVAVTPVGGDYTIQWNNTISPTLTAAAGTSWQLVVTDNITSCETTPETVIIPSYPNVNASFITTPNSPCIDFLDASNVNIIDLSQNATTGQWDFGNGSSSPYAPGQSLNQNFSSPGTYTINLYVMNDAGCEDTSSYTFCVLPEIPIFVPDIFSPNGDGNNDVLFVRGNGIARMEFNIYNRWGEEVFVSTDITRGWDGQLRGAPAQSGSYFYTLKIRLSNNTPLTFQGEVVLIR